MMSKKIVAVFESEDAVLNAQDSLLELGFERDLISITDRRSGEHTLHTSAAHGRFWAHVKEMLIPERDRHTIAESIRRGGYVLVADVDDARVDEAVEQLERSGAVDLDAREGQWRAAGWNGGAAEAQDASGTAGEGARCLKQPVAGRPDAAAGDAAGVASAPRGPDRQRGGTIPVIEEHLRIGKREVNRGSVRVRSYIVEGPVHEEVRLRDERVVIERRPINAPARPAVVNGSLGNLFQERTIEVTETAEQAVVGKEARVTEEVVVSKTANERVERVEDTVRHTEVQVEDNRNVDALQRE